MNRVLALAFLIIAAAPSARPVDRQAPAPASEAGTLPEIGRDLSSFFDQAERSEVTAQGMTVFLSEPRSVIVARVASDGTLDTACVVTEGAARAFLEVRDGVPARSRAW